VRDRTVGEQDLEAEVLRLYAAVQEAVEGLEALRERVLVRAGVEESRIFEAQILMVQDPDFLSGVELLIRNNQLSAETAYEFKALELRNLWASSGSAQLRERLTDLTAIQRRVVLRLMGQTEREPWSGTLGEQVIVVAHELSPGLTVQLDREHVVGLISEEGTRTSHAAILAHSLGIPAVMGVAGALQRVRDGQMILLDGRTGEIILEPTRPELEEAKTRLHRRHRLELKLEAGLSAPAVTPDGRAMSLRGNVDLPEEIEPAVRHGAAGVGLLRTEFLLTGGPSSRRRSRPTTSAASPRRFPGSRWWCGRSTSGGPSSPPPSRRRSRPTPSWAGARSGCASTTLKSSGRSSGPCFGRRRAATAADVPLITRVDEVLQVRAMIDQERAALRAAGEPVGERIPIGVMIETPAAVIIADRLATVSDFFSVGTNDLTQYTLCVDRGNARLADRFRTEDPAILRQPGLQAATAAGIPVSICGEMASEPLSAVLLLGLGFVELSVAPPALPLLKLIVRSVPASAAEAAAARALEAGNADEVREILRETVGAHLDLALIDPAGALPAYRPPTSIPSR
jgi:phosphotransferase system enzyme I (PtsI)